MAVPSTALADTHKGVYIRNVGLDGCLTAVDDDSGESLVRVKPCEGMWSQMWTVRPAHADGAPLVRVTKQVGLCLELIGEDMPWNGRLALRECDWDNPYQEFAVSRADWAVPTWRVSSPDSGSWLKAFHEHEAPYVSQTKEWPGAYAEWEHVPVAP
ncbi:ricin-type beta-trefoil lectin domain protein [Catenuloplanes atrovinosus]|uniref:Uncharacterized protein n=1 Tax=Catenuloplanes atrovinosus TaxID=137266 RepID=A0AAE3YLN0_9ACTN|nr:ricin-type beta-trefoil lectin domain protein [Catenuloplanes atrovinosus]MDR7274787.1 hypothetical protein [Catenuloplanes atrovinosus]